MQNREEKFDILYREREDKEIQNLSDQGKWFELSVAKLTGI